jgi:hypothetical protein
MKHMAVATHALVAFLAVIIAPAGATQNQPRLKERAAGGQKVLVFKARGTPLKRGKIAPPQPPPDLSKDEKTKLLTRADLGGALKPPQPGDLYARLTPKDPSINGKAALVFVGASVVDGGESNYATWNVLVADPTFGDVMTMNGYLAVLVRSGIPGRRYLIDCAVSGYKDDYGWGAVTGAFYIVGPGGLKQAVESTGQTGQHLTFILEALDTQWNVFKIGSNNTGWALHKCEVTNL